jgi:hypothetical protein
MNDEEAFEYSHNLVFNKNLAIEHNKAYQKKSLVI